MLVKAIIVFLGAMVIVAMIGTAVYKRVRGLSAKDQGAFCKGCGRPRLGRAPCVCGKG